MPRNPKVFISGSLIDITTRMEEGLPLVPNKLIKTLLINALARAQSLYPITIINYVIMRNHLHMLAVVKDPSDVPKFLEYFKRESATYINRLLGRKKRTIWCKGYDSPSILDYAMAIRKIQYIHLNPVKAGQCKRGKDWPLSSASTPKMIAVKRIPRDKVPKLPHRKMTLGEIEAACLKLQYRGKEVYTLKVEPDAWVGCFRETKNRDLEELNDYIWSQIKKEEKRMDNERVSPLPELSTLATEDMRQEYQPDKFGCKMICLGSTKEIRLKFLAWYRDQCKNLPRFLKRVKDKVMYRSHYPPGFFSPGGFLSSNLIPSQTPLLELG